ncbi:MAG: ABC transporter permease [Acetobacteraceae bacterium]
MSEEAARATATLRAAPGRSRRRLRFWLEKPELAAFIMLLVLIALFEWRSAGDFLSAGNLQDVLGLLPESSLVAVGVGVLMVAGEFDLSVGSTFAIMPMATCVMADAGLPFWVAAAIGLLICAAIGLVNGLITISFAIPSFITTLGMLYVVRSLTVVISGGFPPAFPAGAPARMFAGLIGPLHASLFWFLALAVLYGLVLQYTNFGNWIYATGGQIDAAQALGIPTRKVKLLCFVICALFAGCAGFLQVMRLQSPLPSLGEGLELVAVAASVIGGISLFGGVGSVLGAVVGAVLIGVIDNGLVLAAISANWFKFAIGGLTIVAVVANSWLTRTASRIKVDT